MMIDFNGMEERELPGMNGGTGTTSITSSPVPGRRCATAARRCWSPGSAISAGRVPNTV